MDNYEMYKMVGKVNNVPILGFERGCVLLSRLSQRDFAHMHIDPTGHNYFFNPDLEDWDLILDATGQPLYEYEDLGWLEDLPPEKRSYIFVDPEQKEMQHRARFG